MTCGNVLQKAHGFYLNNGYKQIDKMEIDMHIEKMTIWNKKVIFITAIYWGVVIVSQLIVLYREQCGVFCFGLWLYDKKIVK